ncbi:hypothetical protein ACJIZ3_022787 [Penstemon smallii]|uniref:Kinetochore protein n=1 Tax=Penstemon smallii TaxID=265156 RepID=A0ABD3TNJ3_9LAMI
MEGSKSEEVFESLNLNPKLFTNEVFNIVDDLLDEAFSYFLKEASTLLKIEGTDRSSELSKGVAYIQNLIQMTLNQRLQKWEEYCLRFCFHVPEEFSLLEINESSKDLPDLDALADTDLDAELNSLRDKLTLVGKDSAELARELRALEKQSLSSNQSADSIDEALQLYKTNDTTQMFQELTNMASEFRTKLGNLKRKSEETQCGIADSLSVTDPNVLRRHRGNGLFSAQLEELQEFLDGTMKSYQMLH